MRLVSQARPKKDELSTRFLSLHSIANFSCRPDAEKQKIFRCQSADELSIVQVNNLAIDDRLVPERAITAKFERG